MARTKKLEMTEEEIVRKYKANPSEKHISILAELNAVPAYRIKRILAAHGCIEDKKGAESQKIQEADKTLIDKKQDDGIKNDFREVKSSAELVSTIVKSVPEYLIPETIKKLVDVRIEDINREILALCDAMDKLSDERNELKAFLRGEFHEKDGIHGKVQTESK